MGFLLSCLFSVASPGLQSPVIGSLTQVMTEPEGTVAISTPSFVSTLTLIVTIIAVVVALIGIVGAVFSIWLFTYVQRIRKEADEIAREIKTKRDAFISELKDVKVEIDSHLLAIKQSAGAFHPSGAFLSEETRDILKDLELENRDCAEIIGDLVEKLSFIFLRNAEFGGQIQKLFVGKRDEVIASVMYLSQKPSHYALSLLNERLDFEKRLPKPDLELIEVLVKAISGIEKVLEATSSETQDQQG